MSHNPRKSRSNSPKSRREIRRSQNDRERALRREIRHHNAHGQARQRPNSRRSSSSSSSDDRSIDSAEEYESTTPPPPTSPGGCRDSSRPCSPAEGDTPRSGKEDVETGPSEDNDTSQNSSGSSPSPPSPPRGRSPGPRDNSTKDSPEDESTSDNNSKHRRDPGENGEDKSEEPQEGKQQDEEADLPSYRRGLRGARTPSPPSIQRIRAEQIDEGSARDNWEDAVSSLTGSRASSPGHERSPKRKRSGSEG